MVDVEKVKSIVGIIALGIFIALVAFAVIWNTVTQKVGSGYWGVIGAIVAAVVIAIRWLFKNGKKEKEPARKTD